MSLRLRSLNGRVSIESVECMGVSSLPFVTFVSSSDGLVSIVDAVTVIRLLASPFVRFARRALVATRGDRAAAAEESMGVDESGVESGVSVGVVTGETIGEEAAADAHAAECGGEEVTEADGDDGAIESERIRFARDVVVGDFFLSFLLVDIGACISSLSATFLLRLFVFFSV